VIATLVIVGLILSPIIGVTVIAMTSNKKDPLSSGKKKKMLGAVPKGMKLELKESSYGRTDLYLFDNFGKRLDVDWDVAATEMKSAVQALVKKNIKNVKPVVDDIPLVTYVVPADVMKEATLVDGDLVFAEERKFQLPRLPYGLTWKVTHTEGSPTLQLIHKNKRGKKKVLEQDTLLETTDNAKEMLRVAYMILQEADMNQDKVDVYYEKPKTGFTEFEGEY